MKAKMRKGFTLVEILIVVVILGILAAIVIPQFSEASTEAKLNSLKSNLQTMRSQVALYRIQHSDLSPAAADDLLQFTDVAGGGNSDTKDTTATPPVIYGPYMQSIPNNPFNDLTTITFGTDTVSPKDDSTGWYVNTDTGDVWANDSGATAGIDHGDL